MKPRNTLIAFILTGMLSLNNLNAQPNFHIYTSKMVHFKEDMRKLWEDHITWTRNVIFCILDDLPGTNEAVARLLQNQDDIGNAIKPYYGNAAGDQLTALLHGHITIAADLLTALKNNDMVAFNLANQQWIDNADSIAMFLSGANPHWDFLELQTMMYDHLNLTAAEASARKNLDYAADVIAYDNVHNEILEMSDMLSLGIIRQFWWQFLFGNREANLDVELTDGEILLSQNTPNPFVEQTVINYFLPENISEAQMNFYNSNGSLIKTVDLKEKGAGSITIHAANLKSGTYSYSMIADGKIIDTKKMVH
jgi:hypothetical protein